MEAALWLAIFVSAGTAIGELLCRLLYVNWKAAHQEPQMASAREVLQRPVGEEVRRLERNGVAIAIWEPNTLLRVMANRICIRERDLVGSRTGFLDRLRHQSIG